MVVYGIVFDPEELGKEKIEEMDSHCTSENQLQVIISDDNTHAMFGTVLDERSCLTPQAARDYSGDYGPTANMVTALIKATYELEMDDHAPDVYVFEPWTQP